MGLIVLGSRGSELALVQTRQVEAALRLAWRELAIETRIIVTRGDERAEPADRRAGRKGLFTREIERALLAGEIDVAVHSAKDLPSEADAALEVRATLPRANVEDVLISKRPSALRSGAVIATGSVRRQHQLRAANAEITMVDLRGNVPTRLRKLKASEWDGIILARAGLERLGFSTTAGSFRFDGANFYAEPLALDAFLPAGGQGIVAMQVRAGDAAVTGVVDAVNDRETRLCLRAEREFLRLLQGDCDSPVGVLATLEGGRRMRIRAQLFEVGDTIARRSEATGDLEALTPEAIAENLMEKINGR